MPVGVKTPVDELPVVEGLRIPVDTVEPSTVQLKVRASEFESVAFAVRLSEAPTATVLPVAAGVCEHEGGEFLRMVHDCVVVEPPFVAVAESTLEALRLEDVIVCDVVVPASVTPLSAHAIEHPPPPVETTKFVVAVLVAGTRTVAADGMAPVITHVELTVTFHVHAVESYPSDIVAVTVLAPTSDEFGANVPSD